MNNVIHGLKKTTRCNIGVGTMGAGGAIAPPPPNIFHSSQCLPDHILNKLLYCT